MNKQIINCPCCLTVVSDDIKEFCPVCNWELFSISDDASEWLKSLFTQKLHTHKEQFLQQKANREKIEEQNCEIEILSSKIRDAHNSIDEAKMLKMELQKSNKREIELQEQVKLYQDRFGDSWVTSQGETKPTIAIKWEMISQMKFRFFCDNIQSVFPTEIVMLLKKDQSPMADGDFQFAFRIETTSKKIIDSKTCELTVSNNELQKGKYFIRFTNLNYSINNLLFFHKDQVNHPTFDRDKTIINI